MTPFFKHRLLEWLVLLNRNLFSSRQTLAYRLILAGLLVAVGAETGAAQWQRYPDAEIGKTADATVEWQKYRDEDTGYEVWQMSSSDAGTWAAHFESQGFSAEDRYVIFSSNRTGNWQLYRADPMVHPGYPYLVSFVPSPDQQNDMRRPQALRARTWIWDARTGEVRPFLTVPPHFRATHETWSRSGYRFFFFQKTQPGWVPNHIASMDKSGDAWQIHHTDATLRLGHGAPSHDDQWFISDGQDPGRNPLRLIHLETGNWET